MPRAELQGSSCWLQARQLAPGTGAVRGASIPTQPAILHAQPRPDEMKASADGYCQGNKQKNLKLEHQTTGSGTSNVLSLQG